MADEILHPLPFNRVISSCWLAPNSYLGGGGGRVGWWENGGGRQEGDDIFGVFPEVQGGEVSWAGWADEEAVDGVAGRQTAGTEG